MWAVLEEDIADSEVTFLLFLHNRPPRNNAEVISFSTIKVFRELPCREQELRSKERRQLEEKRNNYKKSILSTGKYI